MEFSSFLKEVIRKREYSYRKLGNLSGVNHTYISKICGGATGTPSPEILKKLSGPLCIPYEDLLRAAGYLLSDNNPTYAAGTGDKLLLRVARLSPEGRERLSEYLDFLEDLEKKQRRRKRRSGEKTGNGA